MSEWTPTDDEAASMFITGWCCDTNPETAHTMPDGAWSRWLAAHDRALREQIADDLRIEALNEDPDIPDTYREGIRDGLMRGLDIARGEGDSHRPERCPTCGCELAYPTAVHVVDCGEGPE